MTEAEWLGCEDAPAMVDMVSAGASERKLHLFVAAFWGWEAKNLPRKLREERLRRVGAMEAWAETGKLNGFRRSRSQSVVFFAGGVGAARTTANAPFGRKGRTRGEARRIQPLMIRCVFGNPFRPVAPDPAWRTSVVVALAEGIYADRAFDRLPILADALQEAGCDNADVLDHCRGPGPHARGCWVVDLILGKA